MSDLYSELGVSRKADKKTIKRAYRTKVKGVHPDKSTGDHEKFIALQLAYDVLSDDARRERYDSTGESGSVKDEATTIFLMEITKAIEDCPEANALELAKENVERIISELEDQIQAAKLKAECLRAQVPRYVCDGDNLIVSALTSQITQLKSAIARAQERIGTLQRVIGLIDRYRFVGGSKREFKIQAFSWDFHSKL